MRLRAALFFRWQHPRRGRYLTRGAIVGGGERRAARRALAEGEAPRFCLEPMIQNDGSAVPDPLEKRSFWFVNQSRPG